MRDDDGWTEFVERNLCFYSRFRAFEIVRQPSGKLTKRALVNAREQIITITHKSMSQRSIRT